MNHKEDDFTQSTVAIVGLGLMGGSLAFALGGKCKRVIGVDQDAPTVDLALDRGAVDAASTDPELILPLADMIILALPVRAILNFIRRIPEFHPGEAVVMDLGSTKVDIVDAMAEMPKNFDPIGAHPMCGKETSGFENADSWIYRGAPFALTPLERTTEVARGLAETLVQSVEATPIWLDPETHDAWVASTSHFPYLLAVALVSAMPPEAAPLVGPGFHDVSRLAGSNAEMMVDILTTNSEQVLEVARRFSGKLEQLERAIQAGDRGSLIEVFEKAGQKRDLLVGDRGSDEPED
jgi:prephenate dehydrogenase